MKTKISLLILAWLFTMSLSAQTIVGDWAGELNVQGGIKLSLVLHIKASSNNTLTSTMDSPMQGAKDIPVDVITFVNNELKFGIKKLTVEYAGLLSKDGNVIEGKFTQQGMSLPLTFKRATEKDIEFNRPQTPKPPYNYNIEDVSFVNAAEGNILAGTLTTPKTVKFLKSFPVVVMITGSGLQDRDETIFGHKPFWVIADYFTKNGIGVLRLDDRGVGGSSKGKEGATTADFATDINAAVKFIVSKGYKNIGLVGHSEGGMIAPMVGTMNKDVKFLVLMAGPGVPIDELMTLQTTAVLKSSGATEQEANASVEANKKIYAMVKNYKGSNLEGAANDVILKEINNSKEAATLTAEQKATTAQQQAKMVASPWFRYFIQFNPQDYLSKIKIPVLALDGSLDVQVTAKENLAGIGSSLKLAGNTKFQTLELPGLNHLFQEAKTGAVSEYGKIEQTISPKALNIMTKWIWKQNKK
jgi:uncharacterized protein